MKQNHDPKKSEQDLASRSTISDAPARGSAQVKHGHVEKSGVARSEDETRGPSEVTQERARDLHEFVSGTESTEVYRSEGGRDERTASKQ